VGTTILVIIGIPAFLLGLAEHYLRGLGEAPFTILVLDLLEMAIVVSDALTFLVYLGMTAYAAVREFSK
jgi:hypothetical protein